MTKTFSPQGEQIGGTGYYATEDQIGSIRELATGSGTTGARYDYDPYGNSLSTGTILVPSDFQYRRIFYPRVQRPKSNKLPRI